jgi:hypothetical protein
MSQVPPVVAIAAAPDPIAAVRDPACERPLRTIPDVPVNPFELNPGADVSGEAGAVPSAALRKLTSSFENAFSIGLKSGLQGCRNPHFHRWPPTLDGHCIHRTPLALAEIRTPFLEL